MPRSGKCESYSVPTGTAAMVIPASPNRVALIIIGSNAGRVTLSNDPGVTLDNGLTFVQQGGEIKLLYDEFGELVRQAWYGIAAQASSVIGVVEALEG